MGMRRGGPAIWRKKDVLANMPPNGSKPDGSIFKATDQWGGTTYQMIGGTWEQVGSGLNQAAGNILGSVDLAAAGFDVLAIGANWTDVPSMSIAVVARPNGNVMLRFVPNVAIVTGTTTPTGALIPVQVAITDALNNAIRTVTFPGQNPLTGVVNTIQGQAICEFLLKPPVAALTYKIRARLRSAAPTGLTTVKLLPNYGSGTDTFYAIAC